jgi:hypothetical protein
VRRHTYATILLCGWLLMLPPGINGDTNAPIAKWFQESAYDSARECQAGIARLNTDADMAKYMPAVVIGTKCVPAEAVYPPKKK